MNWRFSSAALAILATISIPLWGQAINEDLKITANDGGPGNELGFSVAADQGIIAVGARYDDDNGTNSGSAYLFDAATGAQMVKLLPDDGAPGDEFGFSIATDGVVVAVGAVHDDHGGIVSGSVYLFDASTGTQMAKLTPNDAAPGDEFGFAVAIDGGVVAVGAKRNDDLGEDSGSAYLFDASTGNQIAKLLPDEGAASQNFGVSIAMDGGVVVVGSRTYYVHGTGFFLGAAYLFDVSTGNQVGKLMADNGTWTDFFGDAVDIDSGIVAVGAWARSVFYDHSGAAYLFDASSGSQLAYIVPSDGHDRDHFGISVSIDNGLVAIGAHQDGDNGWVAGSSYLFDAFDGAPIDKLLASDGAAFDDFGSSISVDDGLVVVGAVGDDDNGNESGSMYVYRVGAPVEIISDGFESGDNTAWSVVVP